MRSEDLDHVAHNIPRHRDVLLNELPKQIFMLLPLLLLLLLLLYVLYHVLIRGREAPPYDYVVSAYSRSSSRSSISSSSSSSPSSSSLDQYA